MSVRKRTAAVVLATALAGGTAAGTAPASASTSQGYVTMGSGPITGDWGDEGTLIARPQQLDGTVAGGALRRRFPERP